MSVRNIPSSQIVLDGCASSSSLHDVVIVVEKTSALGSYLPELKASYLVPTLENFNSGPIDEKDYGSLSTSSVYSLITFEAADRTGRPMYECYGPLTSPHKVLSTLEKIQFQDGAGEFHSQIADGLAASLLCLDDIHLLREPGLTPNKHIILICNSPPYNMPVVDVPGYQDLGLDQLTNLMLERLVNLSIMSPRKIPSLLPLFEKAGGDLGMMKNFSKDPRHLVLLRGFGLQERVPSPTPMQQQQQQSAALDQQQIQYRQNQPRPAPPQQQQIQMQSMLRPGVQERPRMPMQQQPVRWQNTMQPTPMQTAPMQTSQMQVNQIQQNPMQQQQGNMLTNQFQQNVQMQQQNANMMQMKQLQQPSMMQQGMGMGMQQQAVGVQGQAMQQNQQNPPQVVMTPQQNQGIMQPGQQMQQPQQQQMQNPQDGPTMQQASKERLLIWNGILEWQEKSSRPGDQNKVVRSVQCKISSAVLNGETEVKADNWPPKLLMQLIPKTLVSNLGGAYFKNARSVLFHPNPGEALDNLARVMSTGYAGCVHFNSSQTGQLCDIKVLMLLYSADKQAYVGFIPVDQAGFVERIRKVIQQQKNRQLGMNPEVAQPSQVMPGQPQPGVSGMMVGQAANLGMGAGQMAATQGQQDQTQMPQITLQANNPGMMNNPAQAQLMRPASTNPQRQQQIEAERQHNLLRIQQLQRELNEKQQREQLFQAQQEQQFTVVQIQNQPGMQQRPAGISVAGMQQNLQQQQQQRMMRPNVPANPGLRHLLQQNPMGQPRMGQPNMGGAMGGMNPQGPPFDDALFDLLQ